MKSGVIPLAMECFPDGGTILEFGVGMGTSYCYLADMVLHGWPCNLIGFDSFQGLPKEEKNIPNLSEWGAGSFSHSRKFVEDRLQKRFIKSTIGKITLPDKHFDFVEGWFKDTLTKERQQNIENLILVNMDVDLCKSTLECLEFITPLLQEETVIYFDDWYYPRDGSTNIRGEKLAVQRWSKAHPEIIYEIFPIRWLKEPSGRGQQIIKIIKGTKPRHTPFVARSRDHYPHGLYVAPIKQRILEKFGLDVLADKERISILYSGESLLQDILNRATRNDKPKAIVEIGTANGCSAVLLSQFTDYVYTFDTIECPIKYDLWKEFGVNDKITSFVVKNIEEAEKIIKGKEFDLAFIDGDHSYDCIKQDSKLLQHCGNLIFSNIGLHRVEKVIKELIEEKEGSFICNDRFGYWSNKKEL